jgi:hypothetical protein
MPRVNITCLNVSTTLTETVVLTFQRAGGVARRIARAVLAPNEQLRVTGLPMGVGDILVGVTTDAATIDYVVSASGDAALNVTTLDATGSMKTGISGVSPGTIGASTAALGTTSANAAVLPAGTGQIYPTTAADGTVGVRINVADQVTGRTLFIGNGVAAQILKVYPPTGGTINGAAADAAFSSASGKGVTITCLSSAGNTWLAA